MIEQVIVEKAKLEFRFNERQREISFGNDGREVFTTNAAPWVAYWYVRWLAIRLSQIEEVNAWDEIVSTLNTISREFHGEWSK